MGTGAAAQRNILSVAALICSYAYNCKDSPSKVFTRKNR